MTLSQSGEGRFESQRFQTPRAARGRPRGRRAPVSRRPFPGQSGEFIAALRNGSDEIPGFAFAEPTRCPEPTYAEWFREEILPSRRMTLFLAFYLHWIALLGLAAMFLSAPEEFPPLALNAVFSDDEPFDDRLSEILETEFTLDDSDPASSEDQQTVDLDESRDLSAMSVSALVSTIEPSLLNGIPDGVTALAVNHADSAASGNSGAGQHQVAANDLPQNAVTAGSFSVWTEPENPDPGEPYKIVIQIRLPDKTERYSVSDLEGVVVGSDGYQKQIPGSVRGFLPIENGQVKFEVHVVSADKLVEDTVLIRSKLLREAQRLQIRF